MKLRYDIEQNTDEWYDIKVAKFSASSCDSLLMDKKTKGYQTLIDRIVEERITGEKTESKTFQGNSYTERGHEFEHIARKDYEYRTFNSVELIGVIELDEWVLCSPDGLIGEDKVHQIKCPIFNTQRKYLSLLDKHKDLSDNDKLKKISLSYYKQEQFELYVSGRKEAIFTSYHPKLNPIDLVIVRDEDVISKIKDRLEEAKKEVLEEVKKITE